MLRLHPAGVACPELVEGLSTNGPLTPLVLSERSEVEGRTGSIYYPSQKGSLYQSSAVSFQLLRRMIFELPSSLRLGQS
jgi:hypothetical protein